MMRAYKCVFQVPPIDKSVSGKKLDNFQGQIDFQGVSFEYETRQDSLVCYWEILVFCCCNFLFKFHNLLFLDTG